jgi:type II secretory pathway component PulC
MLAEMLVLALLVSLSAAPPDLAAVGIILSPRPESSVAILRAGGRSRVVAAGDAVFGGRVTHITAAAVRVEFADGARELRLSSPAASAAPAPRAAAVADASDAASSEPREHDRTMERQELERRLGAEIPRILAETTILPVSNGVGTVGFTLTRVPEGSLLTEAGLRAGDVLTHVNDVAIDSLPTLIALWPKLQSATSVRAHVMRNGQPVSLTVTLR